MAIQRVTVLCGYYLRLLCMDSCLRGNDESCELLRDLSSKTSLRADHATLGIEDSTVDKSSYVYILASR